MADRPDAPTGLTPEEGQALQTHLQRTFTERSGAIAHRMLAAFERLEDADWDAAAKKAPDRHWQGLTQAAKLAGLAQPDRIDISLTGLVRELQDMSDAQLEARQAERIKALGSGVTLSPATPEGKGPGTPSPTDATLASGLT